MTAESPDQSIRLFDEFCGAESMDTAQQAAADRLIGEDPALACAVYTVALPLLTDPADPLREVSRTAAGLLARSNLTGMTQRQVEAVLREALGEPGAVDGVVLPDQYRAVVAAFLAVEVAPQLAEERFREQVRAASLEVRAVIEVMPPISDPLAVLRRAAAQQVIGPLGHGPVLPSGPAVVAGRWAATLAPPRTIVGRWQAALVLRRDEPAWRELLTWRNGEYEFLRDACAFALGAYFQPPVDLRLTTRFATWMVELFSDVPSVLDCEAIIRASLGDTTVSLEGLRPPDRLKVYIRGIALVLSAVDAIPEVVYGLIRSAEDAAIERGWQPIFAPEHP
jgi:hypothetical protein